MGLDAALQARQMVDVDNPTVEGLQTLLLLSQAYFAYGLGKKAYMVFCKSARFMHGSNANSCQQTAWPWWWH